VGRVLYAPRDFVDAEWERAVAALGERVPAGTAVVLVPGDRPSRAAGAAPAPAVVRGEPGVLLEWMFSRGGVVAEVRAVA